MENIKRRIEFFSLYDHTNIEKHLEKMASKGWMIEIIGSTFWRYKRIEPQKLKFSVVYFPKDVNEGTVISADRQNFIDMCTSGGWNYVVNSGRMHVFCTDNEYTPPIETDAEIQIQCIHKFAKSEIIEGYSLLIAVCVFVLSMLGYEAWKKPIDILINDDTIFWHIPILLVFSVYNIISYCIWYKKAKSAAYDGEFTETKRLIKIEALFWAPIYIIITLLFIFIDMRLRYLLFTLGLIALGFTVYKLIDITKIEISKSEYKSNKKRRLKNFVTFLMVVAYIASGIGAYLLIPKPYDKIIVETDDGPEAHKVYHDKGAPLDISDFHDTSNKTIFREKSIDEAILIKEIEWTIYNIEPNDDLGISYKIIDVRFTPLLERCKNEIIYNHYGYSDKRIDLNSDNFESYRFYKNNKPTNFYTFCNDKRIVDIGFGWEPSEEELIFAAEKLLNS